MQGMLTTIMCMFERVVLFTNLGKTKATTCNPGFIWGKMGQDAYKLWEKGEGATFRGRKGKRPSCSKCGATMVASSLRHHMERTHERILAHTRGEDTRGGGRETYVVFSPCILPLVVCLVEGCPARAYAPVMLHEHFMYRHWKAQVVILQEGPPPLPW